MVAPTTATGDLPGSPSSNSQQHRSSSPCLDASVGVGVAPLNPFDAIVDIPSFPSLGNTASGTDASQVPNSASSSNVNSSMIGIEPTQPVVGAVSGEIATSPDRSTVGRPLSPMIVRTPNTHTTQASINIGGSDQSISSCPPIPTTPTMQQQLLQPQILPQTIDQPNFEQLSSPSPQLRHSSGPPTAVFTSADHQYHINFDDDENTEPSSAANTDQAGHSQDVAANQNSNQNHNSENVAGTIIRFLQDTRRRISAKDARKDSDGDNLQDGALICGYLQKYGRNGKWQTRWFETDGECLSYYKSSKRTKLLATLDLEKVRKLIFVFRLLDFSYVSNNNVLNI
jgi:PH domain